MAYFSANPGQERLRKDEKKNYRSDHFLPDPKQGIEKKRAKKLKNEKKAIMGSFDAKNRLENDDKERK